MNSGSIFKSTVIILMVVAGALPLSAQDTTRFCQENGVLFTNCYIFHRSYKGHSSGTFTEKITTNDGQTFYGWGNFKETKTTINLTYSKKNNYPFVKYKPAKVYGDTFYIRWFTRDNMQDFFQVKYKDTAIAKVYRSEHEIACVKIPKSELLDSRLVLFQGEKKISEFTVNTSRNEYISIYADDPRMLYIHKNKEKLEKTKFGFITQGVYSKDKKSNFIQAK